MDIRNLPKNSPRFVAAGVVLIVALTVLAYLPSMHGSFLFDDRELVRDNPLLKASDGLYRFWFTTESPDYYPLTWSLLWLEWQTWGRNVVGYHVVNVMLHVFNALLLWVVLRQLKIPGGWFAALVFALHPVNVTTVAWISEQKNTLSMLFYLVAILLYLRSIVASRWHWYGLSLLAFLLALLAKPSVVMLPIVLLGCVWWLEGKIRRQDWLRSIPFFVLALGFGLVTLWFQLNQALKGYSVLNASFATRLCTAGWEPWFYLHQTLFPFKLSMIYPKWNVDDSSLVAYLPGIILVVCFVISWRNRKTWGRPLLFGLGYFVVTLFPVMGFFDQGFYRYSLVADHWLYPAIIAPIALAVAAVDHVCRRMGEQRRFLETLAGVVVLAFLTWVTWQRSFVFAGDETLWRDTIAKNPGAWLAYNDLGLTLWQAGKPEEAIRNYEQALRLYPLYPEAHYNMGLAMWVAGRKEKAKWHWEQALELKHNFPEAHDKLGLALLEAGKTKEAIGHLEVALRGKPSYAEAHNLMGLALWQTGKPQEAVEHWKEALRVKPDYPEAHNNLGNALRQMGRVPEAIKHFEEAVRLMPDYAEAYHNLGVALLQIGKTQDAIGNFQQAVRIKPGYAEAHYDLGVALLQEGKTKEAIAHYEQALKIKPDALDIQNNLAWLLATVDATEGGNPDRALTLARQVCERTDNRVAPCLDTLAAAYAAAGRFDDATATVQKAIDLARAAGQTQLVEELTARLELYRGKRAYRPSAGQSNGSR